MDLEKTPVNPSPSSLLGQSWLATSEAPVTQGLNPAALHSLPYAATGNLWPQVHQESHTCMAASKAMTGSVMFLNCVVPSTGTVQINYIDKRIISAMDIIFWVSTDVSWKKYFFPNPNHIMKIWKQLWFNNSFLTASKPRWLLIGWQREQEVFFWGVSVWLLLLNCCCERLPAWCGDGTVWEQVTQWSHQPWTRGDVGGAWCVSVRGETKDSLRRRSGDMWGRVDIQKIYQD